MGRDKKEERLTERDRQREKEKERKNHRESERGIERLEIKEGIVRQRESEKVIERA